MEVNRPVLKHCGYIYKITNIINNKIYIGQTVTTVNYRFTRHKNAAYNIRSDHYNLFLYRAIRKYGIENFIVECIMPVYSHSKETLSLLLDVLEKHYILKYKSNNNSFGYNLTEGGKVFPQEICATNRHIYKNIKCCVCGCDKRQVQNGYCKVHANLISELGHVLNVYRRTNEILKHDNFAELCIYDHTNTVCATTKIDIEDIEKVSKIKWHLSKRARGIGICGANQMLHNYILNNTDKNLIVYHINGDNLDNRKSNLKLVTRSERVLLSEKISRSSSKTKGIYFLKRKLKYVVRIKADNRKFSVGLFDTLDLAILARDNVLNNLEQFIFEKQQKRIFRERKKNIQKNKPRYSCCCVKDCSNPPLANGYCGKHYTQLYKYKKIFERTVFDKNEIIEYDNYAEIILYNKNCQEIARTKVDLEDVVKIKDIKWCYLKSSRVEHVHSSNPETVLHNYLLNHTDKSTVVIHKNGDNLDNRKENLVIVSLTEKQQNNKLQSNNTSGHKGVWFCKDRNKWQAQITINNKQKSLGRYNTFEEAVAAREAAEKVYYNKW